MSRYQREPCLAVSLSRLPSKCRSGRSNGSKQAGRVARPHGRQNCLRFSVRWVPPTASESAITRPRQAQNAAPERRPSLSWVQRRTARRACSRTASMLEVVSLGPTPVQ
jgi:hypothetical protein